MIRAIVSSVFVFLLFFDNQGTLGLCHFRKVDKMTSPLPKITVETDIKSVNYDAIVVVAPNVADLPIQELKDPLTAYAQIDQSGENGVFVVPSALPSKKIVFSGTGSLKSDYDDVRSYAQAAKAGIKRAIASGSKAPLLYYNATRFPQAEIVALLGALEALYVPLEVREQVPEKAVKVDALGVYAQAEQVELAKALEAGRIVSRDIGGSDPERMAAPR